MLCFEKISSDPDCRSVVFSGAGKMFTAGTCILSRINVNLYVPTNLYFKLVLIELN